MAGFGSLVEGRPWALAWTRWLGAGFLFVYGGKALWRAQSSRSLVPGGAEASTLRSTLGTLAALTFLNPHVYVDTIVLLGAVGSAQPLAGRAPFALGAIFASLTWFVLIGFGARLLSGFFTSPCAWRYLDAGVGTATLALAVGMAVG